MHYLWNYWIGNLFCAFKKHCFWYPAVSLTDYCMCLWIHVLHCRAHRSQQQQVPLELELLVIWTVCLLGIEVKSSVRAGCPPKSLNHLSCLFTGFFFFFEYGNILSTVLNVYFTSFILPNYSLWYLLWNRNDSLTLFHVSLNHTVSLDCLLNTCIEYTFLSR